MAHQPMDVNDWIEIDKDYTWYIEQKGRVIREQGKTQCFYYQFVLNLINTLLLSGKKVLDSLPENDEACGELLEVLVDWLPHRYPTLFESITERNGAHGIWNKVTRERFLNVESVKGEEALRIVSR